MLVELQDSITYRETNQNAPHHFMKFALISRFQFRVYFGLAAHFHPTGLSVPLSHHLQHYQNYKNSILTHTASPRPRAARKPRPNPPGPTARLPAAATLTPRPAAGYAPHSGTARRSAATHLPFPPLPLPLGAAATGAVGRQRGAACRDL